jgi:hypothetical protein
MTQNPRIVALAVVAVLLVWVIGAAVTRFSLTQMAFLAPVATLVVGATAGILLLWVKVARDSLRGRR